MPSNTSSFPGAFHGLRAGRPPSQPSQEEEHYTTHFVIADAHGNVVTSTQTLGMLFGSKVLVPGTGIWLNNSMQYCTFEPKGNPLDAIAGRRKLAGFCPMIVLRDGKPWVALGTPGGHTIVQTVPQMVMNLIDFGMDVQQALAAPRLSFVEPDVIGVEEGVPEGVRKELGLPGGTPVGSPAVQQTGGQTPAPMPPGGK